MDKQGSEKFRAPERTLIPGRTGRKSVEQFEMCAVSAMGAKEVGAATTVIVADWRQWQR